MKLSIAQQHAAAKQFAKEWADRGDDNQETQTFWITLLQSVFGVTDPNFIAFELQVKPDHVSFIDGYIPVRARSSSRRAATSTCARG